MRTTHPHTHTHKLKNLYREYKILHYHSSRQRRRRVGRLKRPRRSGLVQNDDEFARSVLFFQTRNRSPSSTPIVRVDGESTFEVWTLGDERGSRGGESENWHVPAETTNDVGAAEQLIDSLGGCRPGLTSSAGRAAAAATCHFLRDALLRRDPSTDGRISRRSRFVRRDGNPSR